MSGAAFLDWTSLIALVLLGLALLVATIRVVLGPTLPDRVLALDLLTTLGLAMIATLAVRTGFALYLDIAIALGLVGFLATVAFARYILRKGAAGRLADLGQDGGAKEQKP